MLAFFQNKKKQQKNKKNKNTQTHQQHIVNNLRIEKDDESINPLVAEDVESVSLDVAVWTTI